MIDAAVIDSYWTQYEWAYDEVEPGIWRGIFANEREEDYHIYVMLGDEWIHFAVSPIVQSSDEDARLDYYATLLAVNQSLRSVRFAVDADGDANLLADVAAEELDFKAFARTLDLLVGYTDELAYELRRVAYEPGYRSAKLSFADG